MKKYILLYASFLMLASCSNESVVSSDLVTASIVAGKISVCHNGDNLISISENALKAHIAHGDAVDRDGDGFYDKASQCSEIVDCDDTDTSINIECFPTVTICEQIWMVQNLDVGTYRNGDPIPQITTFDEWQNATYGAWCYYENESANGTTYGRLYNWYAVNDPRGIAPNGWHIPSNDEWLILADCLGGISVAGGKMKEVGTTYWNSPNTDATNESGFTALPGGFRDGGFIGMGINAQWWTSTETTPDYASYRWVAYDHGTLAGLDYKKTNGFSVRCVKD